MEKKISLERIELFSKVLYLGVVIGFAVWLAIQFISALPFEASLFTLCIFTFIYTLVWSLVVGLIGTTVGYVVAALSFLISFFVELSYKRV